MRQNLVEKLNFYHKNKTPFVALIDYEQNGVVCELKDASKNGIYFKFNPSFKTRNYELKTSPIKFEIYKKAFDEVIKQMKKGDVYLLNLCFKTPFISNLSLDEIYEFSSAKAVVMLKDKFVCASPEIFVEINDDKIIAHPMKGTIDASLKDAKNLLLSDIKEFKEHAMVVDLLRNDLAMVSSNVEVEEFRYFSEVFTKNGKILQTSSKISGKIDKNLLYGDIFSKILPVGSMSGTPKIRACEVINIVEKDKRDFYSGVFIHYDGKVLKSYVLIRFIGVENGEFYFHTGGGITAESNAKKEYNELIQKAYFTF